MSERTIHERPRTASRAGFTVIELMMAMTIGAVILTGMIASLQGEARRFGTAISMTAQERLAGEMLLSIESELLYGQGHRPTGFLIEDLGSGETFSARADTTLGFPDQGSLLLSPGTAFEERVAYTGLQADEGWFRELDRGAGCGAASSHPAGTRVHWVGSATPIDDQIGPAPSQYEGQSQELSGTVFYRGDGVGFSFRVLVDPAAGADFHDGDNVRWGAEVDGRGTADGWAAIHFAPVATISEAVRGQDYNQDGDQADTFDLGQLRRRSWNTVDATHAVTDLALCSPMILQEQCAPGADLDGDGFQDPMFLWDSTAQRLRIRLFLLVGTINEIDVTRRVESVIFLRNGARQ